MPARIQHYKGERSRRSMPGHSLDHEDEPPLVLVRIYFVLLRPFLGNGPHVLGSILCKGSERYRVITLSSYLTWSSLILSTC